MTPKAFRAGNGVLGLALLLAIASRDVRAGELYRWVTEDGRIEIGTTPPLGAAAEPWAPGQEAVANPVPASPAAFATARPAGDEKSTAERRTRGRLEEVCSRDQEISTKAAQKLQILENQITRLEAKLGELEETQLAYSQTSCRTQGVDEPSNDCVTSSFHRDAEIARTQAELEEAQQKQADLEQRARAATTDERCAPAAAEK